MIHHTVTSGLVDEHVYDVVYEVAVRPQKHVAVRPEGLLADRWWVHRPSGELTAHVVVPHEYAPQTPLDAEAVGQAGLVEPLEGAPQTTAVLEKPAASKAPK
jgi:hypothetical protein